MKRHGAWVVAAAVVGTCLLFLAVDDPNFDRYQLPKELWLLAAATLLAATALGAAAADPLDALAGGAVLLTGLSAALAPSPGLAARPLALTAATAVLFAAARRLSPEGRSLAWVACVAGPTLVALLALGESFGPVAGLSSAGRAPGASLGQRNEVAHLALLASPAAWALAAQRPGRGRWWALAAAAVLAAAIVQTRSRAAWLVGPAVLATWLALEFGRTRALKPGAAVLLAIALALAASALAPARLAWKSPTPLADTLSRLWDSTHGSGRGRVVQAGASLALVHEHPWLGAGPAHWMVEYPRLRPPKDPTFDPERTFPTGRLPNSDALAFLVERGAPFLCCLAALLALLTRRLARPGAGAEEGPRAAAALAALVAAVGLGLFDAVLELAAPAALAAVVAGCAAPAASGGQPSRWARARGWALALLLALATCLAGGRLAALWLRSRPDAGFAGLERALRWNPYDLEARSRLAEARVLERDCARARAQVSRLAALLPHHPFVHRLQRACPEAPAL